MVDATQFMPRKAAAAYLRDKYGIGSVSTLAKGVVTGDGPEYHKAGARTLYTTEALDVWARSKISGPLRSSSEDPTSRPRAANGGRPAKAAADHQAAA